MTMPSVSSTQMLVLLFALAPTSPCRSADHPSVSMSNEGLRVTLSVPSGLLTVDDLKSGMRWTQHVPTHMARGREWGDVRKQEISPSELIQLESATANGSTIRAEAVWRGHPFHVVFELARADGVLAVAIDTPKRNAELPWEPNWAGVVLMTYPYAFYHETACDTIVPIDEGVLYSPNEVDAHADPRRWNLAPLHRELSMPWWGVSDGRRGVMTLVEDPWDCLYSIQWVETPEGQRTLPQVTWQASKRRFAYPRRVTFRFFDHGGHVAMAKAFRQHEKDRGVFRSWEEKLAENPNVGRLKGALDVWHQQTLTVQLVEDLQKAGIRKCLLGKPRNGNAPPGNGFDPKAADAARDAGYLMGVYHNHSWIQGHWIEKDPSLGDAAVVDASGKVTYMKNAWSPLGRLDRCSAAHHDIFQRHAGAERNLGINYFFTDCTTTGGSIRDCYHTEHPLTRREGAGELNAALRQVGALGLIVGSERGKWWAAGSVHVFEGIETLIAYGGGYYGKGDATHWVGPYLTNKPGYEELCLGYDFNPARRLPLFQLVYHDSVYCTRRWNQDPGRDSSLWDRHDLMNILYGTAPLVFMHPRAGNVVGSPDWNDVKKRYLQTYRDVCGWHEKIGFDEMIDHRFVTDDRQVQETRFSSGWTVVVNFGAAPWQDPRGFVVTRNSFHTIGGQGNEQ